jgi:hypothetical protein
MITDRINNSLDVLFNPDDDRIYRALVCDKDGIIPAVINIPTDIDIGIITGQIEYLRRLSIDLVKQIYIDQASGEFLKYQLEEFFGSLQLENESDVEWVQRTIAIVFQHKISRAMIIYSMRPFSSREPIISNIVEDSAYADFSYADVYIKDKVLVGTTYYFVFPAVTENYSSAYFTIKITLYDTLSSDIYTVQGILDNIITAGISYVLQIIYTP